MAERFEASFSSSEFNFIELLKQKILLKNNLLSRNGQDTITNCTCAMVVWLVLVSVVLLLIKFLVLQHLYEIGPQCTNRKEKGFGVPGYGC